MIWIWGDNGASMEGTLSGTFNEMTTLNGIPLTPEQQMGLLFKHGGLEAWGGDLMAPHYSAAWAWASNTPFDWGKQVASHLGGTRNPLVVHYPNGISDTGSVREHFTHVIDIAPTVLELAGIPAPTHVDGIEQEPLHGFTFADSLRRCRRARAAHPAVLRGRREQGHVQGRLVARDAPAAHPLAARPRGAAPLRARLEPGRRPGRALLPARRLRPGEDLADQHPEKVEELRKLFWEEAERYQVLPILGGLSSFYGIVPPIPKDSKFTYRGRIENIAAGMIPRIYNHSYTISADLVVPEEGAEGVIVAAFDHLGGFSLYVQEGKLKHHYSMLGVLEYTQAAETPLPTGDVSVEMVFAADEPKPATGGEVTLLVNGEPVATGRMEHTVPARFSGYAGMDIGCDNGLVVDRSYADKAPFRFTGEIKQVVFDIAPDMSDEDRQALHEHAAQALAAARSERLGGMQCESCPPARPAMGSTRAASLRAPAHEHEPAPRRERLRDLPAGLGPDGRLHLRRPRRRLDERAERRPPGETSRPLQELHAGRHPADGDSRRPRGGISRDVMLSDVPAALTNPAYITCALAFGLHRLLARIRGGAAVPRGPLPVHDVVLAAVVRDRRRSEGRRGGHTGARAASCSPSSGRPPAAGSSTSRAA